MDRYLAEAIMVAAGNASKMPEFYGLGSEVQRLSSRGIEVVTKTAATCTCLAHCIVLTLS